MKTMKRALAVLLTLVLLCVGVPLAAQAEDDTSDYTPIYTKDDLDNIRLDMAGKYILMNDIIFTDDDFKKGGDFYNSGKGWEPIGTETNKFAGIFNGNGKGIYYLVIHDETRSNLGLFGFVSTCALMNCTLSVDVLGNNNVGAFIGKVTNTSAQISNCKVKGSVKGTNCIGGFVGYAEGTLSVDNCFADCQIEGINSVGGFVGYYNCHNDTAKIQNSLADGRIEGDKSIGGFVGDFYINSEAEKVISVPFQNNENRAEICGNDNVGGLIGYVNASYHHYTYTRIEYSQTYYGQTYGVTVHVYPCRIIRVMNCMNIGSVSVLSDYGCAGGLIAKFGGTTCNDDKSYIEKCYNVGSVEGSAVKGAITSGGNYYQVNNSNVYYLEDCITDATENSGIMKSEDQLRKQSTYENWDFETVWSIDKDAEYQFPTLRGVSNQSEIEIPSNCQHENTQLRNMTDATCTEDGYTGDVVCADCGVILEAGTVAFALGHNEKNYISEPSCLESGYNITICLRCGETLSTEILPRLEHTWDDGVVTQAPTCDTPGVKTYTCTGCDETYTEPVDMLAHTWDDGEVTKEPSCTEAGEKTYTCADCGATKTETIDKLDHELVLVPGKAATCEETGLTDGWKCDSCGKVFLEQQTIDPLAHDPQIAPYVKPTCTESGYAPFVCTRCGETIAKTDPEDPLGHDYQPVYVWADDNSTVTASLTCTRCGDVTLTETAEVETAVTLKPTCSTEGELTMSVAFNCKAFNSQTKTKPLPPESGAHVFKITVYPPTCLDDGYTSHACTLCRYGYADEIVNALGHDWDDGTVTLAPTCTTAGAMLSACKREGCGATMEKKLDADPNAHVLQTVVHAPTCTEEGYTAHLCANCKYGYSDAHVDALGHTPGAPVRENETAATCTANGSYEAVVYCTVCSEELSRETAATEKRSHADKDNNGKCDFCGAQMTGPDVCKYCGKVHDGAFGWLVKFFHNILAVFKR